MGNNFGFISDDEDDVLDMNYEILHFAVNARDMDINHPNCGRNLPVIRKKPSVDRFISTDMYKQIKARCGLTNKTLDDNWNLLHALQKRESGLASGFGSFSANQQRCIANLYIPNQKTSRLMSLESKIYLTKFNRSGSKLLTACQDGCVRIYDGLKGTYHLLNRINARDVQWCITDADFSPNGRHFAYTTWSRSFYIMPLNGSGDECQWIDMESPNSRVAIFSMRFSPTGDKIIGGSTNASVIIGDIESRSTRTLRTHRTPTTDVNAVSYVSDVDPNVIIAGCDDGVMKVYDLRFSFASRQMSKSVAAFIGHFDGITYIDPRNDGYHVLTNSKDQSIKLWDMRQPGNMRYRCSARQQQLELTWDYRWDHVPREFYNPQEDLHGDTSIMTFRGHRVTKTLLRAKFSPLEQTGQRFIYTGCATGRIIIYDVLTGKIQEAIEGHKNAIRDLDWHPTRAEIVSGSWDKHVHLNSYKSNMSTDRLKRRGYRESTPLRRSRRLANRKPSSD